MQRIGLYLFTSGYAIAVLVLAFAEGMRIQALYFSGIIAATLVVARLARARLAEAAVLVLAAVSLAIVRVATIPVHAPSSFDRYFDTASKLEGTVVALPDLRETAERITVETSAQDGDMRFIASVSRYPAVHVGDRVRVSGKLEHPEPFATDGGRTFAYDRFLEKDAVFGVMQPAHADVLGTSPSLWLRMLRVLERTRDSLTMLMGAALPEPESALAVGLIVGGKQGLGEKLLDAFTRSGMLQVVVLSGFNVMIVATALMQILRRLPVRLRYALASASIAAFVLAAGGGSAALRAGVMAFFALTAQAFGRQYDVLVGACASLLVIGIWNPLLIAYDPGFQFSFIATLGLILGSPLIAPRLGFLRSGLLIEIVASTLAAEISLLPLLLWQTGNLSLVSVPANVAAMPLVPLAMGASVFAALASIPLGLVPALLPLAGMAAYVPLAGIIRIATLFASLPLASITLPAFPLWGVPLSYAALVLLGLRLARPPRRGTGFPPTPS